MGDQEEKTAGGPGRVSGETPATLQMPLSARRLPRFGVIDDRGEGTTLEDPQRYVFADGGRDEAEIGRGGIGRVLLAFDRHLHREVAIKELRDTVTGQTQIARFLREARITGQLEHPGVVPVYELAHRADGTLYYGMRLVRGRTLRLAIDACEGDTERRLKLLPHFVSLCQTVAYAHSRGVIHRDIKPTNVMIGEYGETILLDWGIAGSRVTAAPPVGDSPPPVEPETSTVKTATSLPIREGGELGGEIGLTQEGDFLGTPSYVSPEQAQGDPSVQSGCGDVWSLGAVLYELLTGRPPFVDDSITGLLHQLMEEPVVPPVQLDPRIPTDLSSICLKALSRDLTSRYQDARELADELEAFRSGRRVLAHDYTPWEHLVRFAVQKKGVLAAVAAVLAVGVVALAVVSYSWRAERTARGNAQAATARAEAARTMERRERLRAGLHFAQGAMEKADRLFSQRRLLSARIYAAAALVHNPAYAGSRLHDPTFVAEHPAAAELALGAAGRGSIARGLGSVRLLRVLRHTSPLHGVALTPDGAGVVAVSKSGELGAWETSTGRRRFVVRAHDDVAWAVAVSGSGELLATVGRDGGLRIWRAADGLALAAAQAHTGDAFTVAFSPDGARIATGGADGKIRLWRIPGLTPDGELTGHEGAVHGVGFSPDGQRLVSGGRDRTVRIWPLEGEEVPLVLRGHEAVVRHVAFSPDGGRVASASYDKTVRIFDARTGGAVLTLTGHEDEVLHVGFSPDGRHVFSAGWDRAVRIWTGGGVLSQVLEGHEKAVWGGAFSRDGSRLVSAAEDGTLRVWQLAAPSPTFFENGQGYLWSIAASPDGRSLATAGADGAIRVWDLRTGLLYRRLEGHKDLVGEVAWSPEGRLLASAGYDGTVRLHDPAGGRELRSLQAHTGFARSVAFSPDGRVLASAGYDGLVRLWDPRTGDPLARLRVPGAVQLRRVVFSPDGSRIAVAGGDGRVRSWRTADRSEGPVVEVGGELVGLAFSPDGRTLAASSMNGTIALIDPLTGAVGARLSRGPHGVYTVRWSSDGRLLAATGDDSVVTVWDAKTRAPIILFRTAQSVMAADFSADGRTLVFGDSDTALTVPLEEVVDAPPADPARLQSQAEADAGLRLSGFLLVPAP